MNVLLMKGYHLELINKPSIEKSVHLDIPLREFAHLPLSLLKIVLLEPIDHLNLLVKMCIKKQPSDQIRHSDVDVALKVLKSGQVQEFLQNPLKKLKMALTLIRSNPLVIHQSQAIPVKNFVAVPQIILDVVAVIDPDLLDIKPLSLRL